MKRTKAQLLREIARLERERDDARRELSELVSYMEAIRHAARLGVQGPPAAPGSRNRERALAAWGSDMPQWVGELAACCDAASQAALARVLGCSAPAVNQVLGRRYVGRLDRIEALFAAFRDLEARPAV